MNIFKLLITTPLGYILGWINDFVNNYGVAIILFTVLIKLVLLPLGLKQQKAMTKMQKIQPKLKEIQEKYKFDQNMVSQESMKLYKEYGVNPAGGCLPLLIQFPILIGLYQVIYRPLTYILHMSNGEINNLKKLYDLTDKASSRMAELLIATEEKLLNFDFFGLDLSQIPSNVFGAFMNNKVGAAALIIFIIPVLATVTTYFSGKITAYMNDANKPKEEEPKKPQRVLSPDQKPASNGSGNAESMTKTMNWMMPLMTLWLTVTLPSTLGLYWTVSNVLSLIQSVLLNGYYSKKLEAEIEAQDAEHQKKLLEKQKKYNINKKKKRG